MAHRLTQIATRTGDDGSTGLGDGTRVPKDHLRVQAMGDVDELNSGLGVLLAELLPADVRELLVVIQHELFNLGGELSIPGYTLLKPEAVARLDAALAHHNAVLPRLAEFILPAGTRSAALAHVSRTVARRAERAVVHVHASHWCAEELALAPALSSLNRAGSVLIYHAQAVGQRRDALVRYLSTAASVGGATVERADFLSRMHTLGDGQAHLTEKAVAGMLRSYSLIFQ